MPIIKLYANLRKTAEQTEVSITEPTLGTCVSGLVEQIPALAGVIVADGQIRPHFVININGHATTNLDVPVNKDDVIAIFPPIAGG